MVRLIPNQHTDVYTIDGHLVGSVAEAWPAEYASSRSLARMLGQAGSGYFRLAGFKGGDLYVPFEAMSDYTEERIRLNVTRKQLGARGWDKRPAEIRTTNESPVSER